jgi:two-component system, sensor histidine kinase
MSLLYRFMALVFIALLPVGAIEIYNEFEMRRVRASELHQEAERVARLLATEQERMIEGVRQLLHTVTLMGFVRDDDSACQKMIMRLKAGYPDYLGIHVTDTNGTVRCTTTSNSVGINIADRLHWRQAMASSAFAIGEYIRGRFTGKGLLPFALPFTDWTGKPGGAVTALLDVAWMADYFEQKPLPHNASLMIADRNGTLIARIPELPGAVGRRLPERFLSLLEATQPGSVEMPGLDDRTRVFGYIPTHYGTDGIFIAVGLDQATAMQPIDRALRRSLILMAAVLALTLLAAWWGGSIWVRQPVRKLIAATQRWGQGDLSARSQIGADASEIAILGRSFDAMADQLQDRERLREEKFAIEHRMAAVLDSVTDAVFEVDRTWRVVFVNERADTLLGEGRTLPGTALDDIFPEIDHVGFWHHARQAMEGRTAVEFQEYDPPHERWYAVRAFPSRAGLAFYVKDITARERLEEDLRRHRALLDQVMETLPVGVFVIGADGAVLRINAAAQRIWAGKRDVGSLDDFGEYKGWWVDSGRPIEAREWAAARALTRGETSLNEIIEIECFDGSRKTVRNSAVPLRDRDGRISGTVVLNEDITDRLATERQIAIEQAKYRAIVDTAVDAMVVIDEAGAIQSFNKAAETIFGYTADEAVGRNVSMLMPEPDHSAHDDYILNYRRTGIRKIIGSGREVQGQRQDGSLFPLELSIEEWRIGEQRYFTGIMRDITRRKGMEEDLRLAKETAEQADLAKGKFLAAASHDLRQPMQSVMFFANALERHIADEEGRRKLSHLERGLDTLKNLLDSLLDVSRLDAGVVQTNIQEFPLHPMIEHIGAAYAPLAADKGLKLTVSPCRMTVISDRTLLERMVRDLIENALRYTETGEIRLTCFEAGGWVRIIVQDTGIGIPPDQLSRIFEEFHQVGNPERDRQQGLGLGLAIVRRLSNLLSHKVSVHSDVGRGSVFAIEVPLGKSDAGTLPVVRTAAVPMPANGNGCFAVIIDDDAIVLMGLQVILGEWGFEVLAAGSEEQALERLSRIGRRPDIIIADYRLRDGKIGTDAIRNIRERIGSTVPGVILTGETGSECQQDAARYNLDIAHKPVTPRQLSRTLERQLRPVAK